MGKEKQRAVLVEKLREIHQLYDFNRVIKNSENYRALNSLYASIDPKSNDKYILFWTNSGVLDKFSNSDDEWNELYSYLFKGLNEYYQNWNKGVLEFFDSKLNISRSDEIQTVINTAIKIVRKELK